MKRNVSYKDIRFYKFIKIIIAHKKKIERKKEKDRLFISNQYNSHVMILLKKISKWQKLKKDKSSAKFNLSMGHFFYWHITSNHSFLIVQGHFGLRFMALN